jgi:ferric hydroxamate transport system substrate-binding protein
MTRLRLTATTAATAAMALFLTACGTTEEQPAAGGGAPAASSGPVTFTDGRDKTVTLDKPATKVVALEWGEAEMLVSLGVMPVGVADVKGYATWVTSAPLTSDVKDLGTRGEPSVDAIVALAPDLVVMEAERDAPLVGQLEKFVPVMVTKGTDATRNLDRMREDVEMIATAVGKDAEADKLLADFDAALTAGKEKIATAGGAGQYYAMADGWMEGSTVNIRMFGQGALVSQVAIGLGLKNAWDGEVDPQWGLGQTDVEGLTAMKEENPRFFYNASDGTDVFKDGLGTNAIWKAQPFVAENKVHKLPDGIWTFGGPKSCMQYIEALVATYAG